MRIPLLLLLLGGAATACRFSLEIDGPDNDGDGYGELVDCDDDDDAVGPGAAEIPYNGVDDDCDEATRDDDVDGDGHGVATDCDDTDPRRHPDAPEVCNGIDDDCDGTPDDAVSGAFYTDADGDGYGDPATATTTCQPGAGLVDLGGDCDDDDAAIHPNAEEDCDAVDRDCDGSPDLGVPLADPGASVWYPDADGDGFGDDDASVSACSLPPGHVAIAGDCDDTPVTGAAIKPGAIETCDGIDQDCDGLFDENATNRQAFHLDDDGDGFGDPQVFVIACAAPPRHVVDDTDCDDLDATSHPGGTEVCDGRNNDCDAQTDEGAADAVAYFPDVDDDGFGDEGAPPVLACQAPADHVDNDLDCDDDASNGKEAFPGGVEVCGDGLDNDCDGVVDNSFDADPWYGDDDQDGFGDPADVAWGCAAPAGYVDNADDCDDAEPAPGHVNPDAQEVCNGVDDDCDGFVDNDVAAAPSWYLDADGDGYGDPQRSVAACADPPGSWVASGTDCDDADAGVHPGATPLCDLRDNDCSGKVDFDADGDGFPAMTACPAGGDCDDSSTSIYPGAGTCSGGDSCLEIHETWGYTADGSYVIDNPAGAGVITVHCDMTDDGSGPGAGWTRVYNQDFSGGADAWQFRSNTDVTSNAATTVCSGDAILGEYVNGYLFKLVPLTAIPRKDVFVEANYYFTDTWEGDDLAWLDLDVQRLWWSNWPGQGTNLCYGTELEAIVAVRERIFYPTGSTLGIYVGGTLLETGGQTEGFGLDDVRVWVR